MRTPIPEKVLKIAEDIAAAGDVPLTRLTVLKKWFERPGRLAAFGVWVARQACRRKGKTRGAAGKLFDAARKLLGGTTRWRSAIDLGDAEVLRRRLYDFQCEFENQRWAQVRIIRQWNLLLIEKGLDLILEPKATPTQGYKLAADFCQHYDPRYGKGLNGPSAGRIMEIMRFMFTAEALEDEGAEPDGLRER